MYPLGSSCCTCNQGSWLSQCRHSGIDSGYHLRPISLHGDESSPSSWTPCDWDDRCSRSSHWRIEASTDEAIAIDPALLLSSSAFILQLPTEKGKFSTRFRSTTLRTPLLQGIAVAPLDHTVRKLAHLIRLPTNEHQLKVGIRRLTKSAIDLVTTASNTAVLASTTPTPTIEAIILQDVKLVIAWWNVQY